MPDCLFIIKSLIQENLACKNQITNFKTTNMKKIVLVLVAITISINSYSQKQTKNDKIVKLLELTGARNIAMQMLDNIIPMFQKSYSSVNQSFWDEARKEIMSDDLMNLILPIYDKYYTEDDLDQMIAFHSSPVGKKIAALQPQITKESMDAGYIWGQEVGRKVIEKLKREKHIND